MAKGPLAPRYGSDVLKMFERLGLGPDGRPLPGAPGSLLRKPVTSVGYISDLAQLQRMTRAQAASEAPSKPPFLRVAATPKQAQPVYKSKSLAKMLVPENEARAADLRRHGIEAPAEWRLKGASTDNAKPTFADLAEQSRAWEEFAEKPRRSVPAMKGDRRMERKLPACAQDFLRGRIAGDPADITFHRGGGGLPNWFDHHVTYGNDIHLTEDSFDRTGSAALWDRFHEIQHVSQNARMGLTPFDHVAAYLKSGSHDASPYEQEAQAFAKKSLEDYVATGLDRKCRF